jgi:IS6 family transposase
MKYYEAEMILLTVTWYLKYSLSYRDVAEMMSERGLHISHTTIMRWVHEFGPEIEKRGESRKLEGSEWENTT